MQVGLVPAQLRVLAQLALVEATLLLFGSSAVMTGNEHIGIPPGYYRLLIADFRFLALAHAHPRRPVAAGDSSKEQA